ncbi:MAG: LptA/OstA family protein [Calditrichia bacterium]
MNLHLNIFSKIIIPAVLVLSCIMLSGQGRGPFFSSSGLQLIHADLSRGIVENGVSLKILEGNVQARQDTLELYCQRAVYYQEQGKIILSGKVQLVQGSSVLTAKSVTYFEDRKVAIARGNVKVNRPAREMTADYMEYHYETEHIISSGHLILHDKEHDVTVSARKGEYMPQQEMSFVKENAHLWQVDSSATDTLHIFANEMKYFAGENRRAVALDSVIILRDRLRATADSVVYFLDDGVAYLEINPHARQENTEVFGKRIKLILPEQELRQIYITGNARAISMEDSLRGRENQLEGREIVMYISERQLSELQAISNARSQYYLKEQEEDRGRNVASADTIKIFMKSNELDSISVIGGAEGTYYPQNYSAGPGRK